MFLLGKWLDKWTENRGNSDKSNMEEEESIDWTNKRNAKDTTRFHWNYYVIPLQWNVDSLACHLVFFEKDIRSRYRLQEMSLFQIQTKVSNEETFATQQYGMSFWWTHTKESFCLKFTTLRHCLEMCMLNLRTWKCRRKKQLLRALCSRKTVYFLQAETKTEAEINKKW